MNTLLSMLALIAAVILNPAISAIVVRLADDDSLAPAITISTLWVATLLFIGASII